MSNIFNLNNENKRFYKLLVSLCIPIIIQNLISTSVNIIDTVMISSLGEASVASIGVANQYFFLFNMTLSGLTGGAGLFISQFFGKNDANNIKKVTGLNVLLGIILGLLFFIPAFIFPKFIIHFFSYDPEVVKLCIQYFSIIAFCYPLIAVSTVFSMGSRSVRNPKLGMICSAVALISNIILNYGLIFGNLGLPALGVRGAAIATVIARFIEFSLLIGYVYIVKKDYVLKFNIVNLKSIDKQFINTFFEKSTPILLNDSGWAIGTVLYSVAYAKAGTSAIAASQIATSTGNFFIMTAVCVAIGASIMLGNELGADNKEVAIDYAKKFSKIVFVVGTLFGLILILNIPVLLKMFSVSDSLAPDIIKIFVIMGLLMGLKSFNTLLIIGILRSGGDTKYSLFLELGCMWLVSLPLTFIFAIKGAPIYILVLLTYSEEIVKFIFGVPRALSKKWVANIVKEID
ncbi:MATE efflux family protein [[Clostridium] bifermentans ATCC 638]|uniref:MATE efflux family protein n=1 Tax=Paraclostridium bifermentans ATCC 638 = DSM 14991 TaxID=1233171 RepID=T4VVL8_PARBF|nr:MATE family efflux transporter [Paraclostridium bifermentans]EQK45488.1 MATE efflux family protein [[Clostridium] bifermentans ATCC 638] [Paraclostridium bifermentans ATCC 638 = DSM 14991]RIZ57775.1 MATE family efflux transporter [Paraclostridium bifermentans]UAG18047.1 MATE family efflux transporter [Paraclostridium bifermentans]